MTFTKELNVGDQIEFDVQMNLDGISTYTADGEPPEQEKEVMRDGHRGTVVADAIDSNSYPTTVIITFAKSDNVQDGASTMSEMMGMGRDDMAGRTLQFKWDGSSFTMKEVSGNNTETISFARDTIEDMVFPGRALLPSKPLGIGDEWSLPVDELAMLSPTGDSENVKGVGRLIAVETINGRQVATIELNVNGAGTTDGVSGELKLTGQGTADVASSRMIDFTLAGSFKMTMKDDGYTEERSGMIQMVMKSNLVGTGKSAGVQEPAAPVQNSAAAANFNGTFIDGNVAITLKQNGNAATGSLRRGDTTFPIESAAINGNNVTGKFRSGNNSFDFTGTLSGDSFTFKTGTNSYTLHRQADPNEGNPFN